MHDMPYLTVVYSDYIFYLSAAPTGYCIQYTVQYIFGNMYLFNANHVPSFTVIDSRRLSDNAWGLLHNS